MKTNNHPAHGPLTTERLGHIRDVLQRKLKYSNGGNMDYIIADAVKAIDELLEVRKAEPVAFIGERMLEDVTDGARSCGRIWPDGTDKISGERRIPLYTAPPVPEDLLSAIEEVLRISDRDHEAWHKVRNGIASCRAAMLQGDKS